MTLVILFGILCFSHCNRRACKRRLFLLSSKHNIQWMDVWTCDCRSNSFSNSFRNLFFEWVETLRQLPFISCVWV